MLQDYLKLKSLTHRGVLRNYTPILTRFTSSVTLSTLTEPELIEYLRVIQLTKTEKAFKYECMVIQAFLRHLHKRNKVSFNPTITSGRIPYNPHHSATEDEFRKIDELEWYESISGIRNYVITRLLWETGIRISELLSIRYCDINLEENAAKIKTLKNERERWIFWSDDTSIHLENYTASIGITGEQRLFPVTARTIQRAFRKICKDAGIESHLVPHSMRHGKAHLVLKRGGTLKDIQETLGHASIESSMRYLNLSKEEKKERAKMFL